MLDPSAAFQSPEELRDSRSLTTAEKIELLQRWAYDDSEAGVALEEGMPEGREVTLYRRILLALDALGANVDPERVGPTKQHGLLAQGKNRAGL